MSDNQECLRDCNEAKELLTHFVKLKTTFLTHHESLQIMVAKSKTELRDLDKDIVAVQDLIRALEERLNLDRTSF